MKLTPGTPALWCVVWLAGLVGGGGCRGDQTAAPRRTVAQPESPSARALMLVDLPEFAEATEESVRRQIRERHAAVTTRAADPQSSARDIALAYGELGKLLMAARHLGSAETSLLNARALEPRERQWSYYLGHLYKDRGDLTQAAGFFEEARLLKPDDVATLTWLAEIHLAQGRPDGADTALTKALALEPRSVAVLFGLGRVAQARNDHRQAVRHFEAALTVDKKAAAIHYPLAMSYRALGEREKAEAHVKQRGEGPILPTDVLMQEMRGLLNSTAEYERRGAAALNSGDWATAAAELRKGVEIDPADPSLRHRLGTALFQLGDTSGAVEEFQQVVRTSPTFARAHYSLGLIDQAQGRRRDAIGRFGAAVNADPDYVEARLALAGTLRRSERARDSIEHYQRALKTDPRSGDAAFGYAMALVGLGRYGEARDRFVEGMTSFPAHTGFPHALARVLAAAPDDRVRNGQRATALVEGLLQRHQTLELGESMAMALAELGRYDEAATVQRDVIAAAKGSGRDDLAVRMVDNLRAYERRQPCRRPWRSGELP